MFHLERHLVKKKLNRGCFQGFRHGYHWIRAGAKILSSKQHPVLLLNGQEADAHHINVAQRHNIERFIEEASIQRPSFLQVPHSLCTCPDRLTFWRSRNIPQRVPSKHANNEEHRRGGFPHRVAVTLYLIALLVAGYGRWKFIKRATFSVIVSMTSAWLNSLLCIDFLSLLSWAALMPR